MGLGGEGDGGIEDLAARLAEAGLLSHVRGQPHVVLSLDTLDLIIQLVETAEALLAAADDDLATLAEGPGVRMILGPTAEQIKAIDSYFGIRKQVFGDWDE